MKIKHILWGFVVTTVIVVAILFIFPRTDPATVILTGVNLFLVYGYTLATLEIVKINKTNLNYLRTASLSSAIGIKKPETDGDIDRNKIALVIVNNSDNNARDVRIKVAANFNNRNDVASSPYDGSCSFCIQARQTFVHIFKFREEFLSRASLSIERMGELANESNESTQFILSVNVSFLDGFGERFHNPELKWYFSFLKKEWNFIG